MATLIRETSTVTAQGQTTVPKAVRQALGVRTGDQIAFRVSDDGAVSLAHCEQDAEESAVDAFLVFLSLDIKKRPEAVSPMLFGSSEGETADFSPLDAPSPILPHAAALFEIHR